MRTFLKENRILLFFVAIGLLAAIVALGGRMQTEAKNKNYDVVLDYQEIENMAAQSDENLDWWFAQFQEMGINKVGVLEESLNTIMEYTQMPVSANVMYQITKDASWKNEYPQSFIAEMEARGYDDYDVLVESNSKDSFLFITKAFEMRWDKKRYLIQETENGGYIWIDGTAKDALYSEKYKNMDSARKGFSEQDEVVSSRIMYLSLGLLPERLQRLEEEGLEVIPRTASYKGWNDTRYAKAVLEGYQKLKKVPTYMIVAGEAAIGSDDGTDLLTNYIKDTGVAISLIENTTQLQNILQAGLDEVVWKSGYQAVRVFSVWDYIQNRYQYYGYEGAKEIENTLFRAITERNIRVIYYKPIREFKDYHVYVTDIDEYKTMFENLNTRLQRHGIEIGQASVMDVYSVRRLLKVLIGFGCAAAAILLLGSFLPIKRKLSLALFTLGAIGVLGAYVVMPTLAQLLSSFAAAVVFPCLAVVYLIRKGKGYADLQNETVRIDKIIGLSALSLAIGVLISLAGGMMTAAPLSEINFMMEIDIFRGVKAAQLLPLAFFIVAYLAYFGFGKKKTVVGRLEFHDIKDMMTTNIQVWMVALGVLMAGVGAYYIIRTGHDTAVQPSTLEMLFRNELEDLLLARPRNKEFLFAFPAVMMLIYSCFRKFKLWTVLFGVCSVIGMTSVVNTFMHIRTPLYLGFARTAYSLCFGVIIGIVGIALFEVFYRLYKKAEAKFS
ncbi:DUF5693 family protein [Anaerovorax sp. IOR16]|uniref:DUF5693 family protein n=1 Tax=Anaerovorax sp. IOR16 TaxID=2773458 RepID=UPI0019D03B6F|nr:DUF5693 family protein [Anaerovorax sp. IOR16]